MRKLPAPAPIEAPKKIEPPPPKEERIVIETKGFEKVADSIVAATKVHGDATAKLQEVVSAIAQQDKARAFEVEIKRDASGLMERLIIRPVKG